jgi:hypothetical protein
VAGVSVNPVYFDLTVIVKDFHTKNSVFARSVLIDRQDFSTGFDFSQLCRGVFGQWQSDFVDDVPGLLFIGDAVVSMNKRAQQQRNQEQKAELKHDFTLSLTAVFITASAVKASPGSLQAAAGPNAYFIFSGLTSPMAPSARALR